jgi:hypothetical protein
MARCQPFRRDLRTGRAWYVFPRDSWEIEDIRENELESGVVSRNSNSGRTS